MLFDLMVNRAANYYKNVFYDEQEKVYQYLLHKVDPSPAVAKMIAITEPRLIRAADRDKTRPNRKFLLGSSLEDAFRCFALPQNAAFVQSIYEILEDFVAHVGTLETSNIINHFVDGELTQQIEGAVAGSARRQILEDVRKALRLYGKQSA